MNYNQKTELYILKEIKIIIIFIKIINKFFLFLKIILQKKKYYFRFNIKLFIKY